MSRSVFITGATGFVGHHLISLLDSPKYEIYGTAYPEEPQALDVVCKNDICQLDIRREKQVQAVVKATRPDWVFHLAAVSNVGHSWKRRTETLETNLLGTLHILEAVKQYAPQAKVLFVSSSDVYGTNAHEEKALREEDLTRAVSPYGFTKISGELLSQFYADIEGLNIVISRAFPHAGPGQSPDFVCSDWAHQIARIERGLTQPRIMVGNIEVKRDFLDVRDVVRAYLLLMEKGKKGEVYNISSGEAISLQDVLDILLSYATVDIEVEIDPQRLRTTDIACLLGDNQKIKLETGWEPQRPFRQTLLDLLNHWRNFLA